MAKTEEYPDPTPTQAQLDAIKRGEAGVTDTPDGDKDKAADKKEAEEKDVAADRPAPYKTRQAKTD